MIDIKGAEELFSFPAEANVRTTDQEVRRAIHDGFGGLDFWCQQPIGFDQMLLDHVVPRRVGGPDNIYNLVPTSSSMNVRKGYTYDKIAIVPVLSIIRIHYAPKISDALGLTNRPPWWRPDASLISRPASRHADAPKNPIERWLEENRAKINEFLWECDAPPWKVMADGLRAEYSEGQYIPLSSHHVRNAWKRVVDRHRESPKPSADANA